MDRGLKIFIYVVFALALGGLLGKAYDLNLERRTLKAQMTETQDEVALIQSDNEELYSQIEYYSDPHNLEKELRARFNYRLPNEKLIIVIPEEGEE